MVARRGRCLRWRHAALLGFAWLAGCSAPVALDPAPRDHTLYVVRHGGHAGIVFSAAAIPPAAWPARRDFPNAQFFEIGWGDRDYYQAADPGIWLGLKALFWPTPSALHVAAFSCPVAQYFPASEVLALRVSASGLERMVERVRVSHERDANGAPYALGPGLYGTSRFYASGETFHLFKTCNVWTAQVLRAGGVRVTPALSLTAGMLFSQLSDQGQLVSPTQGSSTVGPADAAKAYGVSDCPEAASNK